MQSYNINRQRGKVHQHPEDQQDLSLQKCEGLSPNSLPQIYTCYQNSTVDEQKSSTVQNRRVGSQSQSQSKYQSEDVGLDQDLSLNQAITDAKQYESFMLQLKQINRKDTEQKYEEPDHQETGANESLLDFKEGLDFSPKNKVVSHLVQQCCNLITTWRNDEQPHSKLSQVQHQELDQIISQLRERLFYQNTMDTLLQSQLQGHSLQTVQSQLAQKRESKFSNKLTYDLPITEEQCKREHNKVKEVIRSNNKWLMRHQIKHKIRDVQDQLQRIKICHANRRRQRNHRNNKRQKRSPSPQKQVFNDQEEFSEFKLSEKINYQTNSADSNEESQTNSHKVCEESSKDQLNSPTKKVERLRKLSSYLKNLLTMSDEANQKQLPVKRRIQTDIFESIDEFSFQIKELSIEQNSERETVCMGQQIDPNSTLSPAQASTKNSKEDGIPFTEYLFKNFNIPVPDYNFKQRQDCSNLSKFEKKVTFICSICDILQPKSLQKPLATSGHYSERQEGKPIVKYGLQDLQRTLQYPENKPSTTKICRKTQENMDILNHLLFAQLQKKSLELDNSEFK